MNDNLLRRTKSDQLPVLITKIQTLELFSLNNHRKIYIHARSPTLYRETVA